MLKPFKHPVGSLLRFPETSIIKDIDLIPYPNDFSIKKYIQSGNEPFLLVGYECEILSNPTVFSDASRKPTYNKHHFHLLINQKVYVISVVIPPSIEKSFDPSNLFKLVLKPKG